MASLIENIMSGKYDESFERIEQAIRTRKAMRLDSLRVGSKVRISRQARPTYIAGRIATVKEFRRSRILVTLDDGAAAGTRFQRGIICRPESLEPVE